MILRYCLVVCFVGIALQTAHAQDSVDVTFRYTRVGVSGVTLVGEFNGWSNSAWPMASQGGGLWTRTVRLPVGGNPTPPAVGVPGAWQYKFYYSGAGEWPNDPLNHHVNPADNSNSFIITRDPTIYHFLPNQRQPVIATATPTINAYLFPRVGSVIDTASIVLEIDGTQQTGLGAYYDAATRQLVYTWPSPLPDGNHTAILSAASTAGGSTADTVAFATRAGYVQITTRGGYATWNPFRRLRGIVQSPGAATVAVVRNGTDTTVVPISGGAFALTDTLTEGENSFRALADSSGVLSFSDPVSFTLLVNHAPSAQISFEVPGGTIQMRATESSDPDSGQAAQLAFVWSEDSTNPAPIGGVNGATSGTLALAVPTVPGEYYFGLIARDNDGNADTTRDYFVLEKDGSVTIPTIRSVPAWAREGRIYFLFPKAFSAAGTINEAAKRLSYVRDMGFSVIWMMPVMKNASPINNGIGPGYNIVDLYNVAPEYGTNADFKSFVDQAHALGLKVILDVTPNHTSRLHPWSLDAHQFKEDSRYWTWYEHAKITSDPKGLGDCLDADGFNYYCGFSDQLLNFNWADIDARTEMINVYRYWIKEFGLDGYRFDVYWGPHRRYGEAMMGHPVRVALKQVKPDILLLGEDDGTGPGTQVIYADQGTGNAAGGLDASYDFKLYFNQIRGFGFSGSAINNLHAEIDNGGYYPGENALYMRFMESQDEDRIVTFYSGNFSIDANTTFLKTMPMATVLFTAPGLPMLWNGQEVGWGYGINGSKEARNRSVINWEYQGKPLLTPHYQKLALLRGQFPAFTQHKKDSNQDGSVTGVDAPDFVRVGSTNALVYAFTRPYQDQNGLTVVNFSGLEQTARLDLTAAQAIHMSGGIQPASLYYLNNLYANSSTRIPGAGLDSTTITLPPYGSGVFTVSTTLDTLLLGNPVVSVPAPEEQPAAFRLEQNYPNPFNPGTEIRSQMSEARHVKLAVYDLLGREVAVLVDEWRPAGTYRDTFSATGTFSSGRGSSSGGRGRGLASGVYICRMTAGSFAASRTMLLIK